MVILPKESKRDIVEILALRCLQLWVIIVTRTHHGRAHPEFFEIRDFVEPALHLLQQGFHLSRAELEREAVIIKPSPILLDIPVDTVVASAFMKQGRVDEEIFRDASKAASNKTTNAVKKNIVRALREEVTQHDAAPEFLRPESIPFESIDEEIFEQVQAAKKAGADSVAIAGALEKSGLDTTKKSSLRQAAAPTHVPPWQIPHGLADADVMKHWTPRGPPGWYLFSWSLEGGGSAPGEKGASP